MSIDRVLATSYHGDAVGVQLVDGGRPQGAWAGATYTGRGSKCLGNDNSCGANRRKGTLWCAGHTKSNANKVDLVGPEVVE